MNEETATVMRVEEGVAWVSTQSRSACGHCSASAGCGTATVAKLFGSRENLIQLDNTLAADVGEQVVIGVSDVVLLKAAALAYLLPLVALVLVVALADAMELGEGVGILSGCAGLALGLWTTRRITGGACARSAYRPVMLRRSPRNILNPIKLNEGVGP